MQNWALVWGAWGDAEGSGLLAPGGWAGGRGGGELGSPPAHPPSLRARGA